MPREIKQKLGNTASVTISLASLSSSATASRKSNAIDWTAVLAPDMLLDVKVQLTSGTIANDREVLVFIAQSTDGTNYDDGLTAGDAAYTMNEPSNLRFVGAIQTPVQSTAYRKTFYVRDVPPKFVVVIRNYSGIALTSTEGNHSVQYRAVSPEVQ